MSVLRAARMVGAGSRYFCRNSARWASRTRVAARKRDSSGFDKSEPESSRSCFRCNSNVSALSDCERGLRIYLRRSRHANHQARAERPYGVIDVALNACREIIQPQAGQNAQMQFPANDIEELHCDPITVRRTDAATLDPGTKRLGHAGGHAVLARANALPFVSQR